MLARLFQNITHPNYACVFKAGNSWCVTCRKTFRSPIYYYKRCSSSNNISSGCTEYKSPESHSSGSFISIYRLPQMPIVSTVCRLRVTAGVLFPAHLPILYALVCVGWVPQEYLFYFFGVAAITLIKLWFWENYVPMLLALFTPVKTCLQ